MPFFDEVASNACAPSQSGVARDGKRRSARSMASSSLLRTISGLSGRCFQRPSSYAYPEWSRGPYLSCCPYVSYLLPLRQRFDPRLLFYRFGLQLANHPQRVISMRPGRLHGGGGSADEGHHLPDEHHHVPSSKYLLINCFLFGRVALPDRLLTRKARRVRVDHKPERKLPVIYEVAHFPFCSVKKIIFRFFSRSPPWRGAGVQIGSAPLLRFRRHQGVRLRFLPASGPISRNDNPDDNQGACPWQIRSSPRGSRRSLYVLSGREGGIPVDSLANRVLMACGRLLCNVFTCRQRHPHQGLRCRMLTHGPMAACGFQRVWANLVPKALR